jgi:tetratricopeptide (TPR) repeat protein
MHVETEKPWSFAPVDVMQQAHALAQAGDLPGAARLCRDILNRTPAHFYALFMLGTIEGQAGRYAEAESLLKRAIKLDPRSVEALSSYGDVLLELKRPKDAIEALNKALALEPRSVNALIYRGMALVATGEPEAALKDFDKVLLVQPQSVFALHNRANVLIQLGRHQEAKRSIDAVLRLAPNHVPALANRAIVLLHDKVYGEALTAVDSALKLEPNNPHLLSHRGDALRELGRLDDALAAYESALALKPDFPEVILNCANVLMDPGKLEDALANCDRALKVKLDYAPAMLLKANILLNLGRHEEALANYDAAVEASPDFAEAYYHRGSALLLHGKFEEGWRDFEHRWGVKDRASDKPVLTGAEWHGEALEGRSIVIYSEQGLGDTIQFVRFLEPVIATGAKVTFLCHPNLRRLFAPLAREMEVVGLVSAGRRFDYQCALMSIPHRLAIHSIPNKVPYLAAEESLISKWRDRIGTGGHKIGISWQGNPKGQIDRGRSVPLEKFAPLAGIPGVRLISLQKHHGLDQLERLPAGMKVETLGAFDEGEDAFADTAAIMECLDLVVVSDSAAAHLAGALARPVWVMLKDTPDWRWMLKRSDSPWYPTMRLFRQRAIGDWDSVFADMADALRARMAR